jgi:putative membrane protein
MSLAQLFDDEMRRLTAERVEEAERHTAAEIVVSVHVRSGIYREARWAAGASVAFVVLLLLLFLPQEFDVRTMPVDVLVAFALGAVLAWKVPPVERCFASRASMRERCELAARAELAASGVLETRRRTGVLIYVSALERSVVLVFDRGLERASGDAGVAQAEARLERAAARYDRNELLEGIVELGRALGAIAPRAHDDVDELSNQVRGS